MARRKKPESPAQLLAQIVPGIVGVIAFLVWASPGAWAALKPYVIAGSILAIIGIGFFLYRTWTATSTKGQETPSVEAPAEPTRRHFRNAALPTSQPSRALDAAILEAMEPATKPSPAPRTFTEESFRRMDWLGFEHFVVDLFQSLGFDAKKTQAGPDGGVDIELRQKGAPADAPAQALVQCKARSSKAVGVDKARELLGVIASTGARRGILVTNSGFSDDAREFARANQDRLLLGDIGWILKQIEKQPEPLRKAWEAKHLREGYDVPSCVQCEIKMKARRGPTSPFWGCPNYGNTQVRCKKTMVFRNFDYVHL